MPELEAGGPNIWQIKHERADYAIQFLLAPPIFVTFPASLTVILEIFSLKSISLSYFPPL